MRKQRTIAIAIAGIPSPTKRKLHGERGEQRHGKKEEEVRMKEVPGGYL
jgi:hypothetical protein